MILRSVIKHVREQNWFAVGLDFLIVVVGVYIGIQVANWNDARIEAVLEGVLVESLQRDFETILHADRERYERTIAAPQDLAALIDSIRSGEEPERSVVWPGIEAALLAYATTPPSPTYEELVATGRLSRLTNDELRRALAEFERSRSNEHGFVPYLVEQSYGSVLYEHVDLDLSHTGLGWSGSYRWSDLGATLPYLQERIIYLHALANWRRNSREHAQTVLALIEEQTK